MSLGFSASQLDVDALTADVSEFLAAVPVAEGAGAKLSGCCLERPPPDSPDTGDVRASRQA